jgi:hypothetical protein
MRESTAKALSSLQRYDLQIPTLIKHGVAGFVLMCHLF